MNALQTICRTCHSAFATTKQIAPALWFMEAWSARREHCPSCNAWRTYSKSEFFYA